MPASRFVRVLTIVAPLVACAGLAACGGDGDGATARDGISNRATVSATVRTTAVIDDATGEETATSQRQVQLTVQPHCARGTLDCEGTYTLFAKYRFAADKPGSPRCYHQGTGAGFAADGELQVAVASPDGRPPVLRCSDAASPLTISTTIPMADLSKAEPDQDARDLPVAFANDLRLTVDRSGGIQYAWTGRDGARCTGSIATELPNQRTDCGWE